VLASGGGWRVAYLVLAALAAAAWLRVCLRGPLGLAAPASALKADAPKAESQEAGNLPWAARARQVVAALRDWGTLRWVVLVEVADLLIDVFTGFLALYLVDVVHMKPAVAALAIAIRLGAALAGDAVLILVLERVADLAVLRASAIAAALLYPGFLLVPGPVAKQRGRAGRRSRAAGRGADRAGVRAELGADRPDRRSGGDPAGLALAPPPLRAPVFDHCLAGLLEVLAANRGDAGAAEVGDPAEGPHRGPARGEGGRAGTDPELARSLAGEEAGRLVRENVFAFPGSPKGPRSPLRRRTVLREPASWPAGGNSSPGGVALDLAESFALG
jgi:hypothetical protein